MEDKRSNETIAQALEELAARLEERGANPHRVQAYRHAADTVRHTDRPIADLVEDDGLQALRDLPGVGDSLSRRIAGFLKTGRLELLDELRAAFTPEDVFGHLPGIGPKLARHLHEALGVETLEELEMAAHDGRLEQVEGFGPGRVRALRTQLDAILSQQSRERGRRYDIRAPQRRVEEPPVGLLLSVDREYRERAAGGTLRRIAPRRFNPEGEAWLPVLHTSRGGWLCTALFSNSGRAHQLGRTHDWVVLRIERGGDELQYTVVTETRGDLEGRRVVRGREAECRSLYRPARAA